MYAVAAKQKKVRGNPIKGSQCDPKGVTVGVGTGPGRAPVMRGQPKKRK